MFGTAQVMTYESVVGAIWKRVEYEGDDIRICVEGGHLAALASSLISEKGYHLSGTTATVRPGTSYPEEYVLRFTRNLTDSYEGRILSVVTNFP